MHIKKYPFLAEEIKKVYAEFVIPKRILPSMRSLQFGGKPIEQSPNRIYNCCYLPVDDYRAFGEIMFLLLGGSGVGYSVQTSHIEKLPPIRKPTKRRRFLIGDSIEGWADSIKAVFSAYMKGKSMPVFDFSDIREKGAALITSGGKAPGAQPLKDCLHNIEKVLDQVEEGGQLSSLQVHDLVCYMADAVLAGGIRRAALISLFNIDDEDMLTCKFGNWYDLNPQRGRANNTAVVLRHKVKKKDFYALWEKIKASGSGEPGLYLTNNADWGSNPCCFTGDTKILTPTGYKTFSELSSAGEVDLINHRGEAHKGSVWSTGEKETVIVKNTLGETIQCTDDHIFMNIKGEEVQARELVGQRIMPLLEVNSKNDEYTKLGFIQGDGNLTRLNSATHKGLEVNIGHKDGEIALMFDITLEESKRVYYVNGYNDTLKDLGFDASVLPERGLPSTFWDWNSEVKLSFIRGMYSANGCIIKGARASYKTTSLLLANDLKFFLEDNGISSYITTNLAKKVKFENGEYLCKESYDVNISAYNSLKIFAKKIGFVHKYKNDDLKDVLISKSPMINSVKSSGVAEVFDFNLQDDTHWGVVGGGYIAHNCEIALKPFQFCNLVEINMGAITDQNDLDSCSVAATFLATLQAGYTDFHYLRDVWKRTTEKEALIGVSGTGIASGIVLELDLEQAAKLVLKENARVAEIIGINKAARTTCVKPAGTTSCVLGQSSGIHGWNSEYFIRRLRAGKDEAITQYLIKNHPELVEDEFFKPHLQSVISVPMKAPEKAIFKTEGAINLLERVKHFSEKWIVPGHRKGDNTHNISATINIEEHEWDLVRDWMWDNRAYYNGLSVLPADNHTYKQMPFEACTKEEYEEMASHLHSVDLTKIKEDTDQTDLKGELACAGGACEIP